MARRWYLDGRPLFNLDDVESQLGLETRRTLCRFDEFARSRITPGEFYESEHPEGLHQRQWPGEFASAVDFENSDARNYLLSMMHSDLATEASGTSLVYGLHNYLMNDPHYMRLYAIDGGNERLVEELVRRISGKLANRCTVQSIGSSSASGRVIISGMKESQPFVEEFDAIVLAVPLAALRRLKTEVASLAEALDRHIENFDFPAHYLRVSMLFSSNCWPQYTGQSYWMLDHFEGCCLYDESSRLCEPERGVLGWLLGGQIAVQMSGLDDLALEKAMLATLPDSFAAARECHLETRVHRWVGAVNAMPGGRQVLPIDRRHQPDPNNFPNVFVVGDYLFDTTLNGVLDSANYVANWLASGIQPSRSPESGCEQSKSFFLNPSEFFAGEKYESRRV